VSRDAAGWGMLERTGALDYVTLQGLSILTGCVATNLDALIMKELVDNSPDAARGAKPRIEVSFETGDDFLTLTVRDRSEVFGPVECGALRMRLGWDQETFDGVLASAKRYGVVYEPKPGFLGVSR